MHNERNKYNANFYEKQEKPKPANQTLTKETKQTRTNQDVEIGSEITQDWLDKNYNYNDGVNYYQHTNRKNINE